MKTQNALRDTLAALTVGEPLSRAGLHLFPLAGEASSEDYLLLEEAMSEGTVRVGEIGAQGSVPELRLVNRGEAPVLVLEGDELVGAKQNRVVNSSVLVAANSELRLPVSCVERGRWSRHARPFAHGHASPHLALRRLKSRAVHDSLRRGRGHASDQGAVWAEVDRVADMHDAASPTDALQDTRSRLSERLRAFEGLAEQLPEGSRGAVVALGGRCLLAEIMGSPRAFGRAFRRLFSGYAFEALEHGEDGPAPEISKVRRFLGEVSAARVEEHPGVGAGSDLRFRAMDLSGYALVYGGAVLHAAAFAE